MESRALFPAPFALAFGFFVAPLGAQVVTRASLDSAGVQANQASDFPVLSSGGRYVAFQSTASNLVTGDTNGALDAFVRDRWTGVVTRASVDSSGVQGNADSLLPALSSDGRWVAIESLASNLVAGDTNALRDIFVHDMQTGATVRVSVDSAGAQGNGNSRQPAISADGRFVAFRSAATNLVAGDTNAQIDIFVHDRDPDANGILDEGNGVTTRVSVSTAGVQTDLTNDSPAISGDGRYVAFSSTATNLVAGDTNAAYDIFVRDLVGLTTTRVSVDSGGAQSNGNSFAAAISDDGRFVAFESLATNLVTGDTNATYDVFVRDTLAATTTRVSVDSGGVQGNGASRVPSISGDGRHVVFFSLASNLVMGDTNGLNDVFHRDVLTSTTSRPMKTTPAIEPDGDSFRPRFSPDGGWIAFQSAATNLVLADTNAQADAFVLDRGTVVPAYPSFCFGDGSGAPCPCGNLGATGRGCDNSGATGGARLDALGTTIPDTIVLVCTNELPSVFTIFLQGDTTIAEVDFGDGLRCTGGNLKRLTITSALGGTAIFPGVLPPSVSAQSAALGDPIAPGSTRTYQAYYRDPSTLFCPVPTGNTWNVSNAITLTW